MTTFFALLRKELGDAVREKRFGIYAFVYMVLWGFITFLVTRYANAQVEGASSASLPEVLQIIVPLYFVVVLTVLILAALLAYDAVAKERDSGMLPVLLTTRATTTAWLSAKACVGIVGYAFTASLALFMAHLLGLALGPVVPDAIGRFFLGPVSVLFVFLLSSGLLLSVLAPSARVAIGLGLGIHFPLFVLGSTPLFSSLLVASPTIRWIVYWSPFAIASRGSDAILYGGPAPAFAYGVTLALSAACLVAAYVIFHRQEVTQG